MQPGDVTTTWADLTRSQAELGYSPTTSIETGLAQFADWFQSYDPPPTEDGLAIAAEWLKAGRLVALVVVSKTWGSSPRPVAA